MPKTCRSFALILFLALLLPAAGAAMAEGETEPSGDVRLTFLAGNTAADGTESIRTYRLTVRPDSGRAELIQGFRIPIPTTSFNKASEGSDIVPVTSFSYQNVGFTIVAEVMIVSENRIHLEAKVEDSRLVRTTEEGQPVIASVIQRLDVILADGKPHKVTITEDPEFGSMYLEITAEILY